MKKLLSLFLVACMLLASCAQKETTEDQPITQEVEETLVATTQIITDQAGREVEITNNVTKIVSGYYVSTATLLALGEDDKLVGIEMKGDTRGLYIESAPELIELPGVGSGKGINFEETVALDPDVVILPIKLEDSIPQLEEVGIEVLLIDPETETQLMDMFYMLADVTNNESEYEELVGFYKEKLQLLEDLELTPTKKVYLSSNSSYLSSATTKMYQKYLIETAGGIFAASDLEDSYWANISPEQLQNYNPDVWLTVNSASYTHDEILADERISNINAVKNSEIYEIPSSLESWDYPSAASILGILYTANVLHPEKYTDEMLESDTKEFYSTFYGIDFVG